MTKIHPRSFEDDKLRQSVNRSRRTIYCGLAADSAQQPLDIVHLHSPWCWQGHCTAEEERHTWHQAWETLETMKGDEPGQICAIGVSNFDDNNLKMLMDIANKKISVVQNWTDVFHLDRIVREMCHENGIVYMAYSTFGTQWEHILGRNPVFTPLELARSTRAP
jgi:diketogulonate reductase-like aldo/keto reductase